MKGTDAVRLAVEDAGVESITYVPGYPATELAEDLGAEISINEKVALEVALGASVTGARSLVLSKQLGLNVLADPLVISAVHTVGSGLVVIAADDLGPKGSQAEMDSRAYGPLAELPVLDPRDTASLYASVLEAYQISEWLRVPAIVRVTERLLSSQGPDVSRREAKGHGLKFDSRTWELTVKGRHQKHHFDVLRAAEEASEATLLNRVEISGGVGIIASGYPASLASGLGTSILFPGYSHPLPWKTIRRFVEGHRLVLVAEEPEPFIESQLRMSPKVRGKLTGHLLRGPLERRDLVFALENIDRESVVRTCQYESTEERGYSGICSDCPFNPLYRALAKLEVAVAGDAGCVIKATREPYLAVDVAFGLGSSIGVASGFQRKGVAALGDFALAHSALQGLINAVWQGREVLVVLFKNDVAATTGGQKAPDLVGLLETLVPVTRVKLPADKSCLEQMLLEELKRPGCSAVVAEGRCSRQKEKEKGEGNGK